MPLGVAPRIHFQQPKALCRTFVINWGGLLLAEPRTSESRILGQLPSSHLGPNATTHSSKVAKWEAIHRGNDTKAYAFDHKWAPGLRAGTGVVKHQITAYAVKKEHILTAAETINDRYNECAGALRRDMQTSMMSASKQCAFALSFHYKKQPSNKTSAHTVGLFYSKGGFGARGAGARFFDPNHGSFKFTQLGDMLDFAFKDWLRNFVDGTVNPDPGKTADPRILTYYRVVLIVP